MQAFLQDLRYGARMLLKNPGFTLIAVITLALGIGANTAIFSVVNAVLLRALPYEEPERLVMVWESLPQRGINYNEVAAANFLDWQTQSQIFEQMAAYDAEHGFNLSDSNEPERIQGALVSASIFSVLRIKPVLGRAFAPEEDLPQASPVVALSYGLWQRRFGADPDIIGKTLKLDGRSATVVAILPPDNPFHREADLWSPLALSVEDRSNRGLHQLSVIARLKPGVTLEQAQAEMVTIANRLAQIYPRTNAGYSVNLIPYHEQVVRDIRPALRIFLVAVGFVLLIVCANVANLLLARAASRQKEIAIRLALGAQRWRVIRQLLTESVLLAVLGGALGMMLAAWGIDLMVAADPGDIPRANAIGIDGRVYGFTLLLSLLTGVVFGLAPAWQASRVNLNQSLKESGRSSSGEQGHRLRGLLVVAEVALSLVLLVGAGLLGRSFLSLMSVDPGFNAEHVLALELSLPEVKYREPQQQAAFYQQVLQRVEALPGVRAAAAVNYLPLGGSGWGRRVFIDDQQPPAPGQEPIVAFNVISPDYFRVMEIPVLQGRAFTPADRQGAPPVAIINETMARRFWPNADPVGKRIRNGSTRDPQPPWLQVVGVVKDVRAHRLTRVPGPEMYVPQAQIDFPNPTMSLVARGHVEAAGLAAAIRGAVLELDRGLPVYKVRRMEQLVTDAVASPRFNLLLLGLFAGVALLLAAVGIYGVISYSVSQRTHEIGIRMALGARQAEVLGLVIKRGMMLAGIGMVIGLVASLALTRLLKRLLFGVSATDPLTFIVIALLLTSVALVACWIPARRATKVDPMIALRVE